MQNNIIIYNAKHHKLNSLSKKKEEKKVDIRLYITVY